MHKHVTVYAARLPSHVQRSVTSLARPPLSNGAAQFSTELSVCHACTCHICHLYVQLHQAPSKCRTVPNTDCAGFQLPSPLCCVPLQPWRALGGPWMPTISLWLWPSPTLQSCLIFRWGTVLPVLQFAVTREMLCPHFIMLCSSCRMTVYRA